MGTLLVTIVHFHFYFQNVLFSIGSAFLYYVNHFKLYSSFCASHSKAQKVLHPSKYDAINFCSVSRLSILLPTSRNCELLNLIWIVKKLRARIRRRGQPGTSGISSGQKSQTTAFLYAGIVPNQAHSTNTQVPAIASTIEKSDWPQLRRTPAFSWWVYAASYLI